MTDLVKSGISGLDSVLRGGLPRDQMYAVYGTSGSGKTTLCLQFLLEGVRSGERCLYMGTSETEAEIRRIAHSHGWDLSGLEIVFVTMHSGERPGPSQTMLNPVEIELPQVVQSLVDEMRKHDPQRVVIDSLSEIRLLAAQQSWYQRQLMLVKRFLQDRSCTALLTDTVGEENSILKTIVHGVIEMSRNAPLYGPEVRRLRIEKLRGHSFVSGFHSYDIVPGGVTVFPRLISAEHKREFSAELVGSGISEFDHLLGGGLERGTSTLVQGAPGTGKSALATFFAVAAAQRNERSVFFCFDERISTFVSRSKSLGMDLEAYLAHGLITINQIDPAELSAGEFSSTVARWVNKEDISLVAVDSLNGYAYALPDERFLSVHLHELASFLNLQGIVTLFTMSQQSGFGMSVTPPPFDVSYVSDTVVNLGYFEYNGSVRKAVSVLKRRSGNHERSIRELTMDSEGIHVGPVLKDFRGIVTGLPQYVGPKLNPEHGES